jgi:sporulation protein YqfC
LFEKAAQGGIALGAGLWTKLKIGALQLPREVAQDLPRLTMRGADELMLGNHRGVMRFESTQLCVRTTIGTICIVGDGFSLESIGANLLLLRGKIQSITCGGQTHG